MLRDQQAEEQSIQIQDAQAQVSSPSSDTEDSSIYYYSFVIYTKNLSHIIKNFKTMTDNYRRLQNDGIDRIHPDSM